MDKFLVYPRRIHGWCHRNKINQFLDEFVILCRRYFFMRCLIAHDDNIMKAKILVLPFNNMYSCYPHFTPLFTPSLLQLIHL